ncbi:hypothetical protein TGPRC2_423860 [Toxoplasma gondii TgCatPRC2]|uniref:Uncharacterized protein n=2 Tax=Toxoplasma gondii TaxID=5811 RepID=A0A151HKK1_TOXGO|nr:hypothetical protein TGPRC2_423860 [Toxoplasma gondii TgCatPRC2]
MMRCRHPVLSLRVCRCVLLPEKRLSSTFVSLFSFHGRMQTANVHPVQSNMHWRDRLAGPREVESSPGAHEEGKCREEGLGQHRGAGDKGDRSFHFSQRKIRVLRGFRDAYQREKYREEELLKHSQETMKRDASLSKSEETEC